MALPATFLEELRARTPLPALIGRRVRLTRAGRQYKGCCPFHGEKTPSFHVYEDHFHCFGCGVHGDAISFVMQSEGASFTEAVARLAGEAGLEVPAPTREAAEAERKRHDVYAVLEQAEALFRRLLGSGEGARGLDYLRGREITEATIAGWGLGWAPAGRGALLSGLREQGIETRQAIEAGLASEAEDGAVRGLFFDRVIFPIRDARGRTISFGARTLGDAQPKYLNGPETAVFRKRHSLYGLDRARAAIREGAASVVVEGYLDVLRLHQSGFGGAVAPLGTALTAEQLELLWGMSEAPVLCFDGDKAGGRAAGRALELALPLAQPDRSLRIAALPPGEDPDSLVRTQGAGALQAVLDRAVSLTDALYAHVREATPGEGPEARAMLHKRLLEVAGRIGDGVLGREVRYALLQRFFAAARRTGPGRAVLPSRSGLPRLAPENRQAVGAPPVVPATERARILTALLLRHPDLLHDLEEAFALVDLPGQLAQLRDSVRDWAAGAPQALDSASLLTHLSEIGQAEGAALALANTPMPASAIAEAMPAEAEARWWHFFNLLDLGGLNAQVEQAIRDFADSPSEQSERRLVALCSARDRLRSGELEGDVL